jgi:MATE family multidrug resistance protein
MTVPLATPAHTSPSARVKTEITALWQLAWPILVGQLANVGMAVADVAMAGHASAQDLAGVALGSSIWMIVVVTLMGVMMSVNPTVSHYVGAGQFDRVPHVVRQALWKGLGVGAISLVLANLAALVFDHMELEPAVRDIAVRFVHITSLALPAFACYRVLYGYSASLNQTKPMMAIALAALLLNCLLNWLLIFGNWGFPKLGGVGCAWSTMLCIWFNLGGLLWWMQRSPAYRSTWPFDRFEAPHIDKVRSLLKLGLPIGVTYFAESSAFSLIALLVARFGSTQVAAHQIALNFSSLVFMLPLSLGIALLTRVGQALGAGDPVAARFRSAVGVGASVGLAVVSAALMAVFNDSIAAVSGGAVPGLGRRAGIHQLCHPGLQGYACAHGDSHHCVLDFCFAAGLYPGPGARMVPLAPGTAPAGAGLLDCAGGGPDGGRHWPGLLVAPGGTAPPAHCRFDSHLIACPLAAPTPICQRH